MHTAAHSTPSRAPRRPAVSCSYSLRAAVPRGEGTLQLLIARLLRHRKHVCVVLLSRLLPIPDRLDHLSVGRPLLGPDGGECDENSVLKGVRPVPVSVAVDVGPPVLE